MRNGPGALTSGPEVEEGPSVQVETLETALAQSKHMLSHLLRWQQEVIGPPPCPLPAASGCQTWHAYLLLLTSHA